ncbi:MAG TPA: hypothetical protein VGD31_09075 [Sphingobacteriaceae bacterium]
MKLTSMIMLVGAMVLFAATQVSAQSEDPSRVKILRTPEAGVIKLLYAATTEETLKIRFLTSDGEVSSDKIRGSYPKGFMKRYDVKQLYGNHFWIEVASPTMTVIYRIEPSPDKKKFTPYLEKTVQNHELVAQK